ncbi:MAG: hypothetical protein CL920_12630 [Deltaproteobacteria bacterium]|nr:hypothetical protein [Deltaproteobacteria bacterium]
MNKYWTKRFILLLSLALFSGGALSLTACSDKGTAAAGEACEATKDCLPGLLCSDGKCADTIVPPDAKAPVANAGPDQSGVTGTKVTLNGEKSVSVEGKDLKYSWTLKGPDGSKATLDGADAKEATFTPDVEGTYNVTLVVNDGKDSEEDKAVINVIRANKAPKADAGQSRRIELGTKVDLDGSASSDEDGDKLDFKWEIITKPKDSSASLSNNAEAKTDITPDKLGTYGFQLTVNDGRESDSATIYVTVVVNNPKPEITKLTPGWGPAKASSFEITIEGKNFLYGVTAKLGDQDAKSLLYQSDTSLVATFDLSALSIKEYDLVVKNPDEKESEAAKFKVQDAAAPNIKSVTPDLLITGQSVEFVITGENFLTGAIASFDGKELPTRFVNDTEIRATLATAPTTGKYAIKVKNSDGKDSNSIDITVTGVQAIARSLSLEKIGVDCASEMITITGANFMNDATVEFRAKSDGKVYKPTKTTVKSLTAVEVEFDFTKLPVDEYEVFVLNKGTQESPGIPFHVTKAPGKPKIISAFPKKVLVGDTGKIYIMGLALDKSTQVEIGGKTAQARQINDTTFEVPVDATQITQAGKLQIALTASCKRKSDPLEIEIAEEGTPEIYNLTPSTLKSSALVDLQVVGAGFGTKAKVNVNGTAVANAVRQSAGLFVIPKSNFPSKGTYKVQVENANGKKSDELEIEVADYDLKITQPCKSSASSSYIYFRGEKLRTDEDPGKGGKLFLVMKDDQGQEACKAGGLTTMSNSVSYGAAIDGYVYSSTNCDSGKSLSRTAKYDLQIVKELNGTKYVSNVWKGWVQDGGPLCSGSGGGTTNTVDLPRLYYFRYERGPGFEAIDPSNTAQTKTVKMEVYGSNLGATSEQLDLLIDGKKVDATTDTNFKVDYRSTSYVRYIISRRAAGVHSVELSNKAGKTNTLFISFDAKPVYLTTGTSWNDLISEVGDYMYLYMYGFYLAPRKDFSIFFDGNELDLGTSTTYYLYKYLSSSDALVKSLKAGEYKMYGYHKTSQTKTNELTYRIIEKGAWGSLALNFLGVSELAVRVGDKKELELAHTGFVVDDGNGKKGEVWWNGQKLTDFTNTNPTSSYLAYLTLKDKVYNEVGHHVLQLKNPDGKTSEELYFSVLPTGNGMMLSGYGDPTNKNNIVRANSQVGLTLSTTNTTKNTEVYFAGRPTTVGTIEKESLDVTLDTRGMSPGVYPLWLWDKDKGASNTILVKVVGEKYNADIPKFYSFYPTLLRGTAAIQAAGNKVRFFVYGSNLHDGLMLSVNGKTYPTKKSGNYLISEVDLTGVTKGMYDVFLTEPNSGFVSPKLKLEVQ